MQSATPGLVAAVIVYLSAFSAVAAISPSQKCEASKNQAAGTYFNCLSKAQKAFVTNGVVAKYDAAVAKCEQKLQETWTKLETSAVAGGESCPSEGDISGVQQLLDGCNSGVAEGTAGGTLPPDPQACEADLSSCDGDLTTCADDLASCDGELATCEAVSGLPATGQTTAYGTGSDGNLQKGTARSFTDNGDGTITDNVTGLMWEKKSDDGSIHDKDNFYTWGMGSVPYTMDGTIVTTFLAALNGGGGFAGYTDWRIPNIYELHSLVNFGVTSSGPTVFSAFNNSCSGACTVTTCSCTKNDAHWSSSTLLDFPWRAAYVEFADAGSSQSVKTDAFVVRAVRAGS